VRRAVVGRKTYDGSRSRRGPEAALLFHTLLENAKPAGVDPYAYILEAARRAIASPGTVTLFEDLA
jgi:hypothetical protein